MDKKQGSGSFVPAALMIVTGLFTLQVACVQQNDTAPPVETASDMNSVEVALPYGEGVQLVEMYCVPCHSLRYIEMQPAMPRKAWEKIVDKMIKNYGAPVRDSVTATRIVDYLASIRRDLHD